MDIEPEVLRSAAGVVVAVAVRGESELDVEVPLPVLRVPALEREERGSRSRASRCMRSVSADDT